LSIDRLIRLVLTLPVSTATTERAFSAMKLLKTRLQNKMEDDFLRDCMIVYIEREIAMKFTTDSIIDMQRRTAKFDLNENECSNSMIIVLITPPPIDEEGRERFARLVQYHLLNSFSYVCSCNLNNDYGRNK